MSRFWSDLTHQLKPYVPGEQPKIADLVKLNTNESPTGPSPKAMAAIVAEAADTLRLYPDPEARALRETLARYHGVTPDQVFVGNGSDEVLAHAFAALLKRDAPLLFPDITYSFYPVYCGLFSIAYETVPLDGAMAVRVEDYRRPAGAIILPNPNAPTGVALSRAQQHAGVGLAVRRIGVAVDVDLGVGVLWAVVVGVDVGADLLEALAHLGVQRDDVVLGVVAAADPRLIGDHEHPPAGLVEGGDGLAGAGDPVEVLPAVHVAGVLVQDSVAVEEKGGAGRTHVGRAHCFAIV